VRVRLRGSDREQFSEGDYGTVVRAGLGIARVKFDTGREGNFEYRQLKIIREEH